MQFTISLIALLAAVPATFAAPATNVYVMDSAAEKQTFIHKSGHFQTSSEACLMVCFEEEPDCRKPSVSALLLLSMAVILTTPFSTLSNSA